MVLGPLGQRLKRHPPCYSTALESCRKKDPSIETESTRSPFRQDTKQGPLTAKLCIHIHIQKYKCRYAYIQLQAKNVYIYIYICIYIYTHTHVCKVILEPPKLWIPAAFPRCEESTFRLGLSAVHLADGSAHHGLRRVPRGVAVLPPGFRLRGFGLWRGLGFRGV